MDRDLETLLTDAGQELVRPRETGSAPAFRVIVEGARQALAPLLQDKIYRIGREMLRNAFRHAHASRIEAEIRYQDAFGLGRRLNSKPCIACEWNFERNRGPNSGSHRLV